MTELGVIAAGDPQTASAGATILRAGGNAVDAVVAAACAAFFSEMPLASPAGAGAALWGRGQTYELLDFFTRMPGVGASQISGRDLDFFPVCVDFGPTTQEFHIGRGSAAVPAALDGLLRLHELGGSLPLAEVLAPAVSLGRNGARVSSAVGWILQLLKPIMEHTPGVLALATRQAGLARCGDLVRNTQLADALEALGTAEKRDVLVAIRNGYLAEFGREAGGLLTEADFREPLVTIREPLAVRFRGTQVFTNAPPSSGGMLIAMGLKLAEVIGLRSSTFLGRDHLLGLCRVLGGVSRARQEALPSVLDDPALGESFMANAERWLDGSGADAAENILGSTTHISVLDNTGGAASLTMSNGEGCGHVLPGLGIHMNNFLGEEDINPAGFHTLAPGTPMTTMMSPTIAASNEGPSLVLGSGGSNRIRSVILQVLINRLGFDRGVAESVDAARCHIEGQRLWFEAEGLSAEVREALLRARSEVAVFEEAHMYFGGVHTVGLEKHGFVGVGDRRRDGVAIVVTK